MMSIVRIDHYNIQAPKGVINEVVGFYRRVLALTPGLRPNFGVEGAWLYAGDHPLLHLTVNESATAPSPNSHLNHIAMRCKGLDAYVTRLKRAAVKFTHVYIEELDITQLFFFDPAGIRIELNFIHEKIE